MVRKVLHNRVLSGLTAAILMSGAVMSCSKKDSTDPTGNDNDPAIVNEATRIDCNDPLRDGGTFVNDPNAPVDYIVSCQFKINGDVTIEPGTVIEFETGAGLQVNDGGSLAINGTADEPVKLTGVDKTVGSWLGVLYDSEDTKNSMTYTEIMYAGGGQFNSNGDLGAVIVWADTKLSMSNCTVSNSAAYGFNATYGGAEVTLSNNTFTANDMPMKLKASLLHLATANNDYSGNNKDFVLLQFYTATINDAATWHNINVPYLTSGTLLTINAMLTVEPGTEVHMGQGTYIHVQENGAIKAVGTATDPIMFRGENAVAGAWEGIGISFTSNPLNEIGHAKIMHAGGDDRDGAIYMWAKPVLNVHDVEFSDVKTCAMYAAPNVSSPNTNLNVSNCTYKNCGGEICGD